MLKKENRLAYGLLLIFAALFVAIAIKGLATAQPGDENVYYYMGKLVSEGKVPYRDFFYAHPPLHIYIISSVYKIFGFNIIILKLVPLISTLVSAFFIFRIAEEGFGRAEAVASSLLFLFSYSIMFNSVFSFGIDVATMLLAIGAYFLWNKQNYILAGIFFALAGLTRLLVLAPILAIFAIILLSSKKNFLRLFSAFFAVFLAFNGLLTIFFWDSYLIPVYEFHMIKSFGGMENLREYKDIIKLNWILFSSALLAAFVKEKKPIIRVFAAVSVAYLAFLAMLNRIFGFYFLIVFPFLAVIAGYSIVDIIKRLNSKKKFVVAVSAILALIFSWNLMSDILFLEKIGFKGFERGSEIVGLINSASSKDTLLFGDDSVAPLLALLANRKIALDFADTNDQVFISGVKNLKSVLAGLEGKDIIFIIRDRQGISYFEETREFLNRNCEFLSQFHDKTEGNYILYRCG